MQERYREDGDDSTERGDDLDGVSFIPQARGGSRTDEHIFVSDGLHNKPEEGVRFGDVTRVRE